MSPSPHDNYSSNQENHFSETSYFDQSQHTHEMRFSNGFAAPEQHFAGDEYGMEYRHKNYTDQHHQPMLQPGMHDQRMGKDYNDLYDASHQNYGRPVSMHPYANLRTTDRLLPIANISKIMKAPIPRVAKVAKDSKEIMQKAASEFIAIVTCLAKDICEQENRKTLTGEDLIKAMEQLGMEFYANLGRIYMKRYREIGKSIKRRQFENLDDD